MRSLYTHQPIQNEYIQANKKLEKLAMNKLSYYCRTGNTNKIKEYRKLLSIARDNLNRQTKKNSFLSILNSFLSLD